MREQPTLRFPVVCPECGAEHLAALPLEVVVRRLYEGTHIRLHAPCHRIGWNASPWEIEQIRDYVAALPADPFLPGSIAI